MGGCFSSRCSSSSSSSNKSNIRVVHLNGFVEDFEYPISVSQVTGKPSNSKHFLCTATQLLSIGSKPLNPNTQLQPGQIYFLLPLSTLKSDASPMDFAALLKKLTSIAKHPHCQASTNHKFSTTNHRIMQPKTNRSWKPILDTIREKSFNRRSESEVLQEMYMETVNEQKCIA